MDQINFFKCLADETRFNIVMLVVANQEQCVCDLTEALQLSQPKISRHLALLRALGLLQDRRQGQWVYYRLNPDLPTWVNAVLQATLQANEQWLAHNTQRLQNMDGRPVRGSACC